MTPIDFDALAAELGVANNFDFQQTMLRVYSRAWTEGYHHGSKQSDQMWMNAIDTAGKKS